MYSVFKWMLVAALIAADGDAIARAQTYNLDVTTRDDGAPLTMFEGKFNFTPGGRHSCRAPFLCTRGVRPNFKGINVSHLVGVNGLVTKGVLTFVEDESQGRDRSLGSFVPVEDRDDPPGSVVYNDDTSNVNDGMFTCGEVVSGYAVTCTTWQTKATVAAPEIDTSLVVSGVTLIMGYLAILQARKRSFANSPIEP
jgi:hypothetical protein